MRTVHKFIFPIDDPPFTLLLPDGWEQTLVECQGGAAAMWAIVDTERPKRTVAFKVTGTGHPAPDDGIHIASFQQPPFVWHLWMLT